ncbi:MAG TPA: YkvA family protein [Patescibacteria group bacterium]|nr:YkvA family protein [Patescibacteria group bacterium]
MSNVIQEYVCSNCGLELRVLPLISYSCPNCGDILLPKEEKYKNYLENAINNGKDYNEKINDAIKKIKSNKKVLKNKQFSGVIELIEDLIRIIMDPNADIKVKAIIAAAFLYLFSPIDMIPDIIPGVGYLDDIVIVLIAANMIAKIDDSYRLLKTKRRQKSNMSILIYSITNKNVRMDYNYLEENKRRIWILDIDDVKKYNLSLIDNSLIKAPEQYIGHPYLEKTLVPMATADTVLFDHNLKEMLNIARMLGAKTIKINTQDAESSEKKGKLKAKILVKVNADVDVTSVNNSNLITTYFDEYKKFNEINLNYINELIWFFTNETPFKSIVQERLFSNLKRKQYKFNLETSELFEADMRANIIKKNKLGLNLKLSKAIRKVVEIDIEFFDMPKDIAQNKELIFENIQLALEKRRNELMQ